MVPITFSNISSSHCSYPYYSIHLISFEIFVNKSLNNIEHCRMSNISLSFMNFSIFKCGQVATRDEFISGGNNEKKIGKLINYVNPITFHVFWSNLL